MSNVMAKIWEFIGRIFLFRFLYFRNSFNGITGLNSSNGTHWLKLYSSTVRRAYKRLKWFRFFFVVSIFCSTKQRFYVLTRWLSFVLRVHARAICNTTIDEQFIYLFLIDFSRHTNSNKVKIEYTRFDVMASKRFFLFFSLSSKKFNGNLDKSQI